MNRKIPSVLLIALLNWGLIISSAKAMHQVPRYRNDNSVTEELLTILLTAKTYAPPYYGTPGRLQGGGAR